MKYFRPVLFSLLLVILSFPSFAWWGQTGHRIIGEIAESYLTKKARKAIREILGSETLAMASNWADFVKSDSSFNYLSTWHYINVKQGLSKTEFNTHLQKDTSADAWTQMNFLINELKNKQLAPDTKKLYLRMLIHICGDIHQPLHVGQFEDRGGNSIRVQWFGENTNLHSLWDEKLINFQQLSYTEFARSINHTGKALRKQWQAQPMQEWFYESYQLAEKVYGSITQPEPKLGYRYNYDFIETVNTQLLKGGVRLAGLLNAVFK
jgi:hypothetical protein